MLIFYNYKEIVSVFINYGINYLTQMMEHDADAFCRKTKYGKHLNQTLIKLFINNESDLVNDYWYSRLNSSHPTL